MSRLRTAFSSSITQIFFLFLFSAILYFALSRTGNDINDFVLSGDLAYLANGSGGLRIFSISKPDQLTEINSVNVQRLPMLFGYKTTTCF